MAEIDYTIEINPITNYTIELNEQGPQGSRGYDGIGISSIDETSSQGLVDTYTITLDDGRTSNFDVTNGFSPTATVTKTGTVATITITDKDGTTTANVYDGDGSVDDVRLNGVSVVNEGIAEIQTINTYDSSSTAPISGMGVANAGFITGINSSDVTTALGYTPYDSSNPSGYTSNVGTVTSVNNVQPVNGNVTIDALPSQTGNAGKYLTTDGTAASWGDLSTRNIGEIVASTIPLTDAGLHLLDGALLQYGSYQAFIDYIADLYDSGDYDDIFDTEANWQSAVTTYGVCGKFVYDSVNNTVRLPKITGKVDGTTDLTALGDLVAQYIKLPNITGTFGPVGSTGCTATGAFTRSSNVGPLANTGENDPSIALDASLSSSVYSGDGTDTKIHEQAINVLYYIVIATSTKTDIEVDIDEIATDLNGKADVDLTNCTTLATVHCVVETYVNGTSWYRLYDDGWCEQGGLITSSSGASITLLKSFANTDYSIQLSGSYGSAGNDINTVAWNAKTVSSFTYYKTISNATTWEAKGYIA